MIDLCIIATIRPDIVDKTMSSFMEHVIKPNPSYDFRVIVNIDPVGEKNYIQHDILYIIKKYIKDVHFRMPNNPSVVKAVRWVLDNISSDYVFFKEDDIEILQDVDLDDMLNILKNNEKLASLLFDKFGFIADSDSEIVNKNIKRKIIDDDKIMRGTIFKWDGEFYKSTQGMRAFTFLFTLTKKKFYEEARGFIDEKYNRSPTNILKGKLGRKKKKVINFLDKWDYGYYTFYDNKRQIRDIGKKWKKENGFKKPDRGVITHEKRRWKILIDLIKNKKPKIGAEIGIQKGRMTIRVLESLHSIEKYYAIDPWLWYSDFKKSVNMKKPWNQELIDKYYKIFLKDSKKYKHKIKILRMFSNEASKHIPDGSLDFCFIDGNHTYEYVKEDVKLYLPKVKKGGLLGGHDYFKGRNLGRTGVKKAVDEIFNESEFFISQNATWWKWI